MSVETAALFRWNPPSAITPRGTVVVIPGRGEHGGVYERFGLRLAADGYVVTAIAADGAGDAVADLIASETPAPVVLAGSDTGALQALLVAAGTDAVAAVIAAGTPTGSAVGDADWETELGQRTSCPTHLARLAADADLGRGALGAAIPAELTDAATAARPRVPVLFVHGAADSVAPLDGVRELAAVLPAALVATVRDGRHDAFNDIAHRSVAATVVQFLERVRADASTEPIVTVESTGDWVA